MAFYRLVDRYRPELFHYVRHHAPKADAEDLIQNIWLVVSEHFKDAGFKLQAPFNAWLFTIAQYKCYEPFRHPHYTVEFDEEKCTLQSQPQSNLDYKWLMKVIDDVLTEREKQVFLMRELQDMTYKEIAEQLHIAENTATGYHSDAVAKLREYLKNTRAFE